MSCSAFRMRRKAHNFVLLHKPGKEFLNHNLTGKYWKIIRKSEGLTVGNFSLLVNPAGSLIEWQYKTRLHILSTLKMLILILKNEFVDGCR